jgi:hypothetical protein
MRAMLEDPIKMGIAKELKLDLHAHSEGADAVAQSLVNGSLLADGFIPITAGPMLTIMLAKKAEVAQPIAPTELVLVYSPKSRFAPQFERAANGKANWWDQKIGSAKNRPIYTLGHLVTMHDSSQRHKAKHRRQALIFQKGPVISLIVYAKTSPTNSSLFFQSAFAFSASRA